MNVCKFFKKKLHSSQNKTVIKYKYNIINRNIVLACTEHLNDRVRVEEIEQQQQQQRQISQTPSATTSTFSSTQQQQQHKCVISSTNNLLGYIWRKFVKNFISFSKYTLLGSN